MTTYIVYHENRIEARTAEEALEALSEMNGLRDNFQYFADEAAARTAYDAITLDAPRRFSSPAAGQWSFYDGKLIETIVDCDEIDGENIETIEEASETGSPLGYDAEIGKVITYIIRDREAGNVIEEEYTLEAARATLADYEDIDRKEGTYTPNFYEIVDSDGNIIDD